MEPIDELIERLEGLRAEAQVKSIDAMFERRLGTHQALERKIEHYTHVLEEARSIRDKHRAAAT